MKCQWLIMAGLMDHLQNLRSKKRQFSLTLKKLASQKQGLTLDLSLTVALIIYILGGHLPSNLSLMKVFAQIQNLRTPSGLSPFPSPLL